LTAAKIKWWLCQLNGKACEKSLRLRANKK
jgi:hypothetical protein